MADAATTQVIPASDRLRSRLGAARLDADALARAQAALQGLSPCFAGWLEEEAARLEAARDRFVQGAAPDARAELQRSAHDLKGLAGTCGQPLVTRVCDSLCRLLDAAAAPPRALLDGHVEQVGTLLRAGVSPPGSGALAACEALEARVATHLQASDPRR